MVWKPDYAQLADVKNFLRIEPGDTTDDAHISRAITAASRAVDEACNRQFGKVDAPESRVYTARPRIDRGGGFGRMVIVDDLMSLVGVVVKVSGVVLTAPVRWWPLNAPAEGRPYTRLLLPTATTCEEGAVDILAPWGWTAIPTTITEATFLQSSRVGKRRDAPFGVAGSPELGSELRLLAKVDPDVAVMVKSYRRKVKAG